jgi:hypothetical protein
MQTSICNKVNHFNDVLFNFHTSFFQSEVTVSGYSPTRISPNFSDAKCGLADVNRHHYSFFLWKEHFIYCVLWDGRPQVFPVSPHLWEPVCCPKGVGDTAARASS